MKKISNLLGMFLISVTTTIIIFTGALLIMMFSSGENGLRTTLFDALFFKVSDGVDGATNVELGAHTNFALVFFGMTLIIFILTYAFSVVYSYLDSRKKMLLALKENNGK